MNLSPAKSQKAEDCPISFILDARGSAADEVTLFIRPEDMSRSSASRTTVNQTLGGAWIDSFGEGLETHSLSGTLGWRAGPDGQDGAERLKAMRDKTFTQWHKLRQQAVDRGDDPNDVKLRFVDTLNSYSSVIVPQAFEIRRSKSRPLLASYRISFIAVGKGAPGSISGLLGALGGEIEGLGLNSLASSLDEINAAINNAKNFVNNTILAPVTNFMRLSSQVFTMVHSTIQNGLSLADPFIMAARGIAQTGVNVFRTLAAVASIPSQVKCQLMQVAGAYSNTFCVLKNALSRTATYEDYSPLYGASNCSSTAGGLPPSMYAEQNPFYAVTKANTGSIAISPQASSAISTLAQRDLVLAPLPIPAVGSLLTTVNAGVSF